MVVLVYIRTIQIRAAKNDGLDMGSSGRRLPRQDSQDGNGELRNPGRRGRRRRHEPSRLVRSVVKLFLIYITYNKTSNFESQIFSFS